MKTKLVALVIICAFALSFVGCVPGKKHRVGTPIGIPIIDVSGMWIGQECYLTLTQKGDKLEGNTKLRYTKAIRQFTGTIDGNHIILKSLTGNITYDLIVQKKKMKGTYSDNSITAKPVTFKR